MMDRWIPLCLQSCFLLAVSAANPPEYFSSSGHLTNLLHFELTTVNELKRLVQQQELRLEHLRQFYERTRNLTGTEYGREVIEHPLALYKIIKRYIHDWWEIKKSIHSTFLDKLHKNKLKLPTDTDLAGAKSAILRLQNTFHLSSQQIADGIIQEAPANTRFDADDAYDIGLVAYSRGSYNLSSNWMYESLRLLDIGRYPNTSDYLLNKRVRQHLSWSQCKDIDETSSYACANAMYKTVSRIDGGRQDGTSNKIKFDYSIYDDANKETSRRLSREESLCRGETDAIPKEYRHMLICWYKRNHPLLILKPAMVERIYQHPELVIFHDAITEGEMRELKQIATPELQRALIRNPVTGESETANYRTSKSAWLREEDYDVVMKLNTRAQAYTGLQKTTFEELQIANYGIGGHYETHYDFYGKFEPWKTKITLRKGNYTGKPEYLQYGERIATMLFYLSDVLIGGATVFTHIGQVVKPSKGDALFWYNLNHDGTGDHRAAHAACPVLIGEKWVSNLWIHEFDQEFRRRCKLHYDDD